MAALVLCFGFNPPQVRAQASREILRLGRGTANALDWRTDGKVLAVGSATGIWLYDENFEPLAYFEGSSVSPVRWSPSGDRLAFADDTGVHIWSIAEDGKSGNVLLSMDGSDVFTIAWKPNGEQLAISTHDSDVNIWDTQNGEIVYAFANQGYFAAWKPDGKQLGIAGDGISIIDTQNWQPLQHITAKEAGDSIVWSSDGKTLATSCFESEGFSYFEGSCIWDAETGAFIASQEFARMVWSPQGDRLLYFGSSGFENIDTWIQVLQWPTRETQIKTGYYSAPLRQVMWHPNTHLLTGLAFNGTLVEFDSLTGDIVSEHLLHTTGGQTFKWSPDSLKIAATDQGVLTVWSLPDAKDNLVSQPQFSFDTRQGTYTTGSVKVFWTSADEFVTLEQTGDYSGNVVSHLLKRSAISGEIQQWVQGVVYGCAYILSNGLDKFACSQDNGIHLLIVSDSNALTILPINDRRLLEWSPDDTVIAMLHYIKDEYSTIEFRNSDTGDLIYGYDTENFNYSPMWSPDGKLIATYVDDGTTKSLNILDSETYETVIEFAVGYEYTWSSNSRILAVTNDDSVTLYDAQAGEVMATIEIEWIAALAWSPDGTMLALGMNDGTIRIWDVSDLGTE